MSEETIRLALCPHIKTKELEKWKYLAGLIAEVLQKKVEIEILADFSITEELIKKYHIFYSNPDTTLELLDRGFLLLGKLRDEEGSICSITSKDYTSESEVIRVAMVNQRYFFLPLLLHKKEYRKFKLTFARNFDEITELVRKGKADIGFIYTSPDEFSAHDYSVNYSGDFCFPLSHFVMIHPSLEQYKELLLSIEDFRHVSSEEIENMRALYRQLEDLLRDWAYHDISEALITSPNIGIIIYHERIIFTNEYTRNILGYSEEELKRMSSQDVVYPEDRQMVVNNIKRRLKGEKFSQIYDIRFQRKDGSVVFVECLTNTILFRGLYCGFIVFYDMSSKKYSERFKEMLMQINRIITESLTEEEIYHKICVALVEKLNLKLAWVGEINDAKSEIIPIFRYGEDRGIFDVFDYRIPEGETLTSDALFKGEISINSDSRLYLQKQKCASELISRGFMSSCTIPLFKFGKIVSLLKLYSDYPQFFNELILPILKEIQHDISFALERVDRIRQNTIISEALKNSDTWILVTDESGKIVYVNEAVERISGYRKDELIGKNPRIFKSGLNPPEFYKEMWSTILSGKIFNAITPSRKKNGEIFHVDLKIIPVKLPGDLLRFVAVAKDVTENLMLSERIQILQNYDALTGLLNMNGFLLNVSQKLYETRFIGLLVLLDIYDMTYVNKIYGIQAGDQILKIFAERLKKTFTSTEIIARISADSFGIYLMAETSEDIYKTYSKLYELNNSVFTVGESAVNILFNASIAIFPKDGSDFKVLYERADITLQQAKKAGPGVIQFFNNDIEKEAEKLWKVFNLIKKATEEELFSFYYQPYFYSQDLKVAGFEALVRIIEGDKIYMPSLFIDYLENSQYLNSFENWAVKEVTEKIKSWNVNISLNISGKTFGNPMFLTILSSIPEEVRDRLTIEITERVFINNPEYAMEILRQIKTMENSPKIAMDDFGTGYSSMLYLRDLPVDIIKIDRAFIKDILIDNKSLAIVQTIVELAKRLDKKTLAEGVELKEQYETLKSMGCDMVQGYFFSKPLPEREILQFLK